MTKLRGEIDESLVESLYGSVGNELHPLGDLTFDLNANDYSSLTFRSGTSYVSGWADAGSAGADAIQATEARQALYGSAVALLNGAPGVQFDSALSHWMSIPGLNEAADEWTVLLAYGAEATAAEQYIFHPESIAFAHYYLGDTTFWSGSWKTGAATSNAAQVLTYELVTGGNARIRRNGSNIATGISYTAVAMGGAGTKALAANNGGGGAFFDGAINRIAAFRGALSASKLRKAEIIMGRPIGVNA